MNKKKNNGLIMIMDTFMAFISWNDTIVSQVKINLATQKTDIKTNIISIPSVVYL